MPPRLESRDGSCPSHGLTAGAEAWLYWTNLNSLVSHHDQLLESCWDTTTPGPRRHCQRDACSIPGQVPLTARTAREAEEHPQGKTQGRLAPVFHHYRDAPNHLLQARLCTALYRSLFGSAHMLTAIWGWITLVLMSILEKIATDSNGPGFHTFSPEPNTWIFYCRNFLLQPAMSYCRSLNRLQACSFTCSLDCHLTFWVTSFISSLAGAPRGHTPAPQVGKPFPCPGFMAALLFMVDLGNGERNRSSWNLKMTRVFGLLFGYIRDLLHPSADRGLDI